MIIVRLKGGLGNQMFQYAAGRSLALSTGAELKLDLSFFEKPHMGTTPRQYELGRFNICASLARPFEVAQLSGRCRCRAERVIVRLFQAVGVGRLKTNTYCEPSKLFDENFESLSGDVYLDGYWQSEKYFLNSANVIRSEFTQPKPPSGKNAVLANAIKGCESVSVHIRRGDYVTDPQAAARHGSCSLEYYRRCADLILEKVDKPHFFVFSDDPEWTIEHLKFSVPTTFVTHNGPGRGWEDLRLMSLCHHNIIANSSFSWWGAWLNRNPGKIILAPAKWFAAGDVDLSDLFPPAWIKV